MSGRRGLQIALCFAVVVGVTGGLWFRGDGEVPGPAVPRPVPSPRFQDKSPTGPAPAAVPPIEGESRLADDLNISGGTIQKDLEILNELFATWQSNFPRTGNPVGENSDITAALAGDNDLRFAFISHRHRAINDRGELCDRWGTPFRFHQLSGRQMEIRSAGADRKFGTDDDAARTPSQ